tara:strand:+ start:1077 stop:1262 length:186 start_codon:yes stop_codon:yes gene_type:complete
MREKSKYNKNASKMADNAIASLNVKKFAGEWVRVDAVRKLLYNTFSSLDIQLQGLKGDEEE